MELARPLEDSHGRTPSRHARRLWLIFGPPALLLGIGSTALVVTSEAEPDAIEVLAVLLPIAWGFIAAGLVAWSRAPANRTGRLMIATGFAWFLAALTTANSSFVFSLGVLLGAIAYAFLLHLYLAYPSGRLHSRLDLAVVVLAYLTVTVFRIPWLLFQEWPNDECPECPPSSFQIADEPGLASAADATTSTLGIAIVGYVVVAMIRRWRSASPRTRRVLAPVLLSGAATFTALIALLVCEVLWADGAEVVQWVVFALLATVPVAFLIGLLRTRLATAAASRFLIEAPPTPDEAQSALRRALGDPTLELAYWLPERDAYVDTAGAPYELPPDGDGRMTTPIAYEQRPVAALVHDESLRHEPELVEAVVAAARVTLEKDRLAAELRARLDELQRERDFVATVVDTASAFFCVVDLEGRILRFNRAGERMTGRSDSEAVRGSLFWDVFAAPEQRELVRRRIAEAASAGGSTEIETAVAATTGERRMLAWSSTPIVDAQGGRRLLVTGTDVTERTQQALELERERDFGHAVTDTTPSFLVVLDEDGRIAPGGVNLACEQALGRAEDKLVGERFVDVFVPPAERDAATAILAEAAAGAPAGREGPWRSRDGAELWVAWSCRPLAAAGAARRFLVCGNDLTQRQRQARELQRERDVLNTIANTASSLLLIVDDSGVFTTEGLNSHAQQSLGHGDPDAAGRDFVDFVVAPEDAAQARRHFERAVAARDTSQLDSTWITSSGEPLRIAWSATWLARTDDDLRDLFLVCGTDVTERVRHAEEMQRERDFINTVANATPSLLCVIDPEGRIATQGSNTAFEQVLGYDADEVGGLLFWEALIAPPEREDVRAKVERVIAGGASFEQDNTWLTKAGDELEVAWSCIAPSDFEERGLCVVCGVDVSERKRQEDELRASRARIVEAADAERRRLERNLHDGAQQRLVTLSLSLRLVEARLGPESDPARLLRAARDELGAALDELRDLARGIHPAVLSDHGLNAALEALAARVPLPVEIERAVVERLPEQVEVAAYYVVSEALANVQKYADASCVRIGVGRENGQAVVEVHDDGVGGADAASGSGLRGLADRVEALGGRLEVESRAGSGTTVRARIPV